MSEIYDAKLGTIHSLNPFNCLDNLIRIIDIQWLYLAAKVGLYSSHVTHRTRTIHEVHCYSLTTESTSATNPVRCVCVVSVYVVCVCVCL